MTTKSFGWPAYVRATILITLANLLLLLIRNLIVGEDFYAFLRSNLFIGSFPVILIAFIIDVFDERLPVYLFWFLAALWIIFYPNAPYMISDLIHNGQDPTNQTIPDLIKYDTLLIFSISMLSVFYGFLSLKIMYRIFNRRYGKTFARTAIHFTLILSCLGFYMGRELLSAINLGNGYLYSWEIFLEPMQIIRIVWNALFPIQDHLPAYYMIGLFGIVQYLLLYTFGYINDVTEENSKVSLF